MGSSHFGAFIISPKVFTHQQILLTSCHESVRKGLKTKKPKSKLLILDAKDTFSKQKLFQKGWAALYPDVIEWVALSAGGKVNAVDATAMILTTDFATHKADVANVIPAQKAGQIAELAGVADRSGWCPIDP